MQCLLVCTCCTCLDTKDKETKRRCRGCVLLFRTCIFSQDRWHLVPPSELARRQNFPFDVTKFVALSSKKSPNPPNPPGFGKSCAPSLIILDTIQERQAKIAAPTLSFSELQADHWRAAESLLQSASDALRWKSGKISISATHIYPPFIKHGNGKSTIYNLSVHFGHFFCWCQDCINDVSTQVQGQRSTVPTIVSSPGICRH